MKVTRKVQATIESKSGHRIQFSNDNPPRAYLDLKDPANTDKSMRAVLALDELGEVRDLLQAAINEVAASVAPVSILNETKGKDPTETGWDGDCG